MFTAECQASFVRARHVIPGRNPGSGGADSWPLRSELQRQRPLVYDHASFMTAYTTMQELLRDRVEKRPDAPCLIHHDRCWTYAEFAAEVERVARAFAALPLRAGQKVALLLPNGPEFLWTVFAMARTRGVFVPLNTAQTTDELRYLLTHSEARVLLTTDGFLPVIETLRDECPGLEHVVTLGSGSGNSALGWDRFIGTAGPGSVPDDQDVSQEDLASIIYTSGTTDRPKGVMLKHYAFAFAPSHRARALGWTEDDRVLVVMPLFHVNALCHMTIAMMSVGGAVVLKERFSASRFWADVIRHGVTTSSIMQTIPRILLNLPPHPADAETPLRQVMALLPPDVHLEFERRFGVTAVPSYSLTEDLLSVLGPLETSRRKLGSCGVAIAPEVHRLRICNEEGESCGPGEPGEIVKRSPAVMAGYYKNPEATAAALRDGWLHTGDLGYLDEDGFLYFVDRKKDMIKRSGENIASAEVERVLNSHPLIAECAVVAVADPIRQEEVKACIVLADGAAPEDLPPERLWEFCAEHLAPFKVPRYLDYRQDLPKTPSSKVQKNLLRDEGVAAGAADRQDLAPPPRPPGSPNPP